MKITKRQLRQFIQEAHSLSISPDRAEEVFAMISEMGFRLYDSMNNILPTWMDSNSLAVDDAMAAYPGEFTEVEVEAAVKFIKDAGWMEQPSIQEIKISKRQIRKIIKETLSENSSDKDIAAAVLPHAQAQDWTAAAEVLLSIFSYPDLQLHLDDSTVADELENAGVSWDDMRKIEDAAWPIEDKRMQAAIAADPDKDWLEFLGNQWSSQIEPSDMKDIKWKEYKRYIRLSPPYSISHGVGEIHIPNEDLTPSPGGHSPGTREEFVEFLTNRAGKTLKKRKIYRSPPPYYD